MTSNEYYSLVINIGFAFTLFREDDKHKMLHEAAVHRELRHENIVTLYATVVNADTHICGIISEFMENGSMKDFLKWYDIPCLLKIKMIHDIAKGMHHLHTRQKPIIHGDVKSSNILINGAYTAKV